MTAFQRIAQIGLLTFYIAGALVTYASNEAVKAKADNANYAIAWSIK